MNIDVREYLRINPISVHELTLSDNQLDGFILFNNNSNSSYRIATQKELFNTIQKSIFGNLIKTNDDGSISFNITPTEDGLFKWVDGIGLSDTQFKGYTRRTDFKEKTGEIDSQIQKLEDDVNKKLEELQNGAILNYRGAVELMTSLTGLYSKFKFALEQILCIEQKNAYEGYNQVSFNSVIQHKHSNSRAETTTKSLVGNKRGWNLIENCTVGNKQLVSVSSISHQQKTNIKTKNVTNISGPLTGNTIGDWRNPSNPHNNVPPSYNIYVRYNDELQSRDIYTIDDNDYPSSMEISSIIEPIHTSELVSSLDDYVEQDYTTSDVLLRLEEDEGNILLKKQSVKFLASIFSEMCSINLSYKNGDTTFTMDDILRKLLDELLVLKSELVLWFNLRSQKLKEISDKIILIRQSINSVKPRTYKGRIIISTTDDIESKVIKNYGGKRWKRIVNFLRGVEKNSSELGDKFGEEFVCLRESNVPNHKHTFSIEERNEKTMILGVNQEPVLINSNGQLISTITSSTTEYQISPLEYNADEPHITFPHDNMPQYREAYIWECVEGDDIPDTDSGDIVKPSYGITYDMKNIGSIPSNALRSYTSDDLPYTPPSPDAVQEYDFNGWTPAKIPVGSTGNWKFTANWSQKPITQTYYSRIIVGAVQSDIDKLSGITISTGEITKSGTSSVQVDYSSTTQETRNYTIQATPNDGYQIVEWLLKTSNGSQKTLAGKTQTLNYNLACNSIDENNPTTADIEIHLSENDPVPPNPPTPPIPGGGDNTGGDDNPSGGDDNPPQTKNYYSKIEIRNSTNSDGYISTYVSPGYSQSSTSKTHTYTIESGYYDENEYDIYWGTTDDGIDLGSSKNFTVDIEGSENQSIPASKTIWVSLKEKQKTLYWKLNMDVQHGDGTIHVHVPGEEVKTMYGSGELTGSVIVPIWHTSRGIDVQITTKANIGYGKSIWWDATYGDQMDPYEDTTVWGRQELEKTFNFTINAASENESSPTENIIGLYFPDNYCQITFYPYSFGNIPDIHSSITGQYVIKVKAGEDISLPDINLEIKDYTFIGWAISDDENLVQIDKKASDSKTYYGVWKKNEG